MAYVTRAPARINPLLQPNVEMMIAPAISIAPVGPKIAFNAALATRSSGAV